MQVLIKRDQMKHHTFHEKFPADEKSSSLRPLCSPHCFALACCLSDALPDLSYSPARGQTSLCCVLVHIKQNGPNNNKIRRSRSRSMLRLIEQICNLSMFRSSQIQNLKLNYYFEFCSFIEFCFQPTDSWIMPNADLE